jgi:hypothetical protein
MQIEKSMVFSAKIAFCTFDGFAKSRHSRAGGNPWYLQGIEKTGFPFPRE